MAGLAMPRFYFDVHDGERFTPDRIGVDLDDAQATQREAARALPEVAKDALPDGTQRSFVIEVKNEAQRLILRAKLSLTVETIPDV
jgi:hypothetical protein